MKIAETNHDGHDELPEPSWLEEILDDLDKRKALRLLISIFKSEARSREFVEALAVLGLVADDGIKNEMQDVTGYTDDPPFVAAMAFSWIRHQYMCSPGTFEVWAKLKIGENKDAN